MGKLPFVVAPRLDSRIETIGSEISGKIEIERKGYLTVGEKGFMANVNSQDDVIRSVMKVSRLVSKKYKIGQQEAYAEVVAAITDPTAATYPVMDDFDTEVAELATLMMVTEQKKRLMMAFCMLLYRVDDNLEMDDITELHEDLVEALADLYIDEENKSTERLMKDEPEEPSADDLDHVEKK